MRDGKKFDKHYIELALDRLSMCRYFPSDSGARAAIGLLLARICPNREALDWLVGEFVDRVGEWRGPVELRAVLCWHYRPADGIEATSQIPGYRPEDGEALNLERHAQLTGGGWTEEAEPRRRELPMAPESRRLIASMVREWKQ